MTSHVLTIGPAAGRLWRWAVAQVAVIIAWAIYPAPEAAIRRFRRRPDDLWCISMAAYAIFVALAYTGGVGHMWVTPAAVLMLLISAVSLTIQHSKWHAGRVADYTAACVSNEGEDFALSPEERQLVYSALRVQRAVLRMTYQRDTLLSLVADNLCSDIAHAQAHKDVSFLANLGNVVMPVGCTWRAHIQQAAGVARSRLYEEATRPSQGGFASKG